MKEIRWGMIGCGEVTEVKSGPAFAKAAHSRLVAVCRRNKKKLEDYATRHNVPFFSTDSAEVIHHPEVNAIYVATPPSTHKSYALQAIAAGKAVYVEKPMALRYSECLEMQQAASQARVPLMVAYYRRALPNFRKIKTLIDEGAIGEVRLLNLKLYLPAKNQDYGDADSHWRVQPKIAGGGYFFDLGSHQLDILDYFLGPIEAVHGNVHNQAQLYEAEDVVNAVMHFKNGAVGSASWCFTVPDFCKIDNTEIIGSKGRISFSTFDNSAFSLETADGRKDFAFNMPEHIQQPLIENVIASLRGEEEALSTGESALRTALIMDRIVSDYYGFEIPCA